MVPATLRCIDLSKSYLDLLIRAWLAATRGQRIPVTDGHDQAEE